MVVEVTPIFDTFCSGVSKVEAMPGDLFRVWYYALQSSNGGDGPPEQVLVAKVVIPASAMPPAIELAMTAIGRKASWHSLCGSETPRTLMGLMAAALALSLTQASVSMQSRIGGDHLLHTGGYGQATTHLDTDWVFKPRRS